jgi:S1-C subfamily serine protease
MGPADQAGLQVDDVITAVDGLAVEGPAAVVSAIERRGVGETVTIQILRANDPMDVRVKPVDLSSFDRS